MGDHRRKLIAAAVAALKRRPPRLPWGDERPRRRADCIGRPRPCPWVTCRYHVTVDVNKSGGLVVLRTRRHVPIAEVTDEQVLDAIVDTGCALDIAERGPHTLDQLGQLYGLTRERIRQLIRTALFNLRPAIRQALGEPPES